VKLSACPDLNSRTNFTATYAVLIVMNESGAELLKRVQGE